MELITHQPYEHDGSRTKMTLRLFNDGHDDTREIVLSAMNRSNSSIAGEAVFALRAWDIVESRCASSSSDQTDHTECVALSVTDCGTMLDCSFQPFVAEVVLCIPQDHPTDGPECVSGTCEGYARGIGSCACDPA